jgi:hypothetical protein
VPYQVFADDSGNKGQHKHFVMAGMAARSEAWADFTDEWKVCLNEPPRIRVFKMREVARCTGQFRGVSRHDRDKKLKRLAEIINRYVELMTFTAIDLDAHAATWAKTTAEYQNEPYFWPFQNTILATCFSLWDAGVRDRFEAIFDEQLIFGPRARKYYPAVLAMTRLREPEAANIMPIDPIFRSDDEFLPIQAADMFAWVIRKASDDPTYREFEWLLDHMKSVNISGLMYQAHQALDGGK